MNAKNKFTMTVLSKSANESFTRASIAAFAAQLDPTIEEINDIKTAGSEAVTNCIVHAYKNTIGKIYISSEIFDDGTVRIKIRDKGCGIENVSKAMEPLFTTVLTIIVRQVTRLIITGPVARFDGSLFGKRYNGQILDTS